MYETKLLVCLMQACHQMLYRGTLATRKTIERLWRRVRVTGNVVNRPRSGRPCVTTVANDRYIILQYPITGV